MWKKTPPYLAVPPVLPGQEVRVGQLAMKTSQQQTEQGRYYTAQAVSLDMTLQSNCSKTRDAAADTVEGRDHCLVQEGACPRGCWKAPRFSVSVSKDATRGGEESKTKPQFASLCFFMAKYKMS